MTHPHPQPTSFVQPVIDKTFDQIKKGFVKEFLQTTIVKPLIVIKDPELLLRWFNHRDTEPLPKESDIFKSGTNYVNFIHLYFTIATEIGVFHDLVRTRLKTEFVRRDTF